jgi:hypothetical protein
MEASLTALQRIQRLEANEAINSENMLKIMEAFNGAIAQEREHVSNLEGVVNAIVEIVDKTTSSLVASSALPVDSGTVIDVLKKHIAIRRAAQVAQDKAAIAALVETGSLVGTDVIAEDSLIVGEEANVAGGGPGWQQMEFSNVKPDFKPLLLGKKVGDDVQLGEHTLTIKEVYKVIPKAPEPPAGEAPPEAAPVDEKAMAGGYVAQEFAEAPAADGADNTVGYSEPA